VSDRAPSTVGSTRARWWWLAAPVLLTGVALAGVCLSGGSGRPMHTASAVLSRAAGTTGAGDLSRLPAQAQSVVSAAISASDPRFAPRRSRGRLGLAGGGVTASLDGGGVRVTGSGAQLSLGLVSVGRSDRLRRLPAVLPRVRSHRVVYARGGGVLEWYAAGPLGIEQGFTLARRPAGTSGTVTLALAAAALRPRQAGSAVDFLARSGRVALRYGGLVARDARGRRLHAWLSLSGRRLLVRVADRGARYPLLIDPLIQQGPKLTATDESGAGQFGYSVALSGDGTTALVGGVSDAGNSGAVWVFTRTGGTWTQQGPKLTAGDPVGASSFGWSVALSWDGNTALITAPGDDDNAGAAYVFARSGSTWTQQGPKLTPTDSLNPSRFGLSGALSGDGTTALIGGPVDRLGTGSAWVFTRSRSGWAQQGPRLAGSGESILGGFFGSSVALSGDGSTALIGGNGDNDSVGAAWVFTRSGNTWSQQGPKLIAPDPGGAFGSSVALSLDGGTALVGDPDIDAVGGGAAWVFARSGNTWSAQGPKLAPTDETGQGHFGASVALSGDGDTALIGAHADNGQVGAAWVFARSANTWTQQGTKLAASDESGQGMFGSSVALSSDAGTALVGAPGDNRNAGAAWTFGPPAGSIYWDNTQAGTIGSDTIDGDPANVNQSLVTGIKQIDQLGVVVDRQHLYWTNGLSIERSDLDGTNIDAHFITLPAAAQNVAVDDQYIYWSNFSEIGRAKLDGTGVTADFISLSGDDVGGLAVDGSHIYWADGTDGTVGRANLDGTGVDSSFITDVGHITGVAVDSQHIYWTELTGGQPAGGSIGRANIDGTDADPSFITGAADPRGIAVDYAHIYWANYFDCGLQQPVPGCGGTIGRASLAGSDVNQAYITADEDVGAGCGTSPQTRCGPSTVAVSAPTQPICMRAPLTPAPVPPPGGAVFARPLDPASSDANVVILPAGTSWSGDGSCLGVTQGADEVMSHPTSIAVAPDAALLLRDQLAGLASAWGARDVGAGAPAPVLFPGRSDWQTTEVDLVSPQTLLSTYGGCPSCIVPRTSTFDTLTPVASDPNVAYQHDVSGATLTGFTLSGSFDNWTFSGADLTDATMNGIGVNGADFSGADLRGAQLTSLQFTVPPTFAHAQIGAVNGSAPCTTFTDTNLVNAHLSDLTADMAGCATIPLLPGSTAPLALIHDLTVADGATVDYSGANFLVTGADYAALAGADLNGINLGGTQALPGASFLGFPADFEGTTFNGASLTGTSFQLADLANAQFESAVAPTANFDDADLNGATFAPGQATDAKVTNLENATFNEADVDMASFQSADLTNAQFKNALADGTDFNSVEAHNVGFRGAHIYDGATFAGARNLTGADFTDAALGVSSGNPGLDLTGADLTDAKFDNAQCVACNFTQANLTGVAFDDAYLPGAQLSSVTSLEDAVFGGAWLYCGRDLMGNPSDASCTPPPTPPASATPEWPVALGSQETSGLVSFTSTTLTEGQFTNVTDCPNGDPPTNTRSSPGCTGQLFPSGDLFPNGSSIPPAPCSAAALDACPTPTSTVFDATAAKSGAPISVVPATPPTWSSPDTNASGYYVGLNDGTVWLVGGSAPDSVVAQSPDPAGLAIGLDGSLYIADPKLHEVRRFDPSSGTISTVAGTGTACSSPTANCGDGGQATSATLSGPSGVWVSPSGEVFIADGVRGIRDVRPDGTITTIGPAPGTYNVVSVTGDTAGNLYAATNRSSAANGPVPTDNADYIIEVNLATGQTQTVVGTGTSGYNGTNGSSGVEINRPGGLSVMGGLPVEVRGDVVFADTGNDLIRAYDPRSHKVKELGGLISNGVPQGGFNLDGNFADQTEFDSPAAVTVTRGSLLAVADTGNSRLRLIGPNPASTPSGLTGGNQPRPTSPGPTPIAAPPSHHPVHRRLPTNHFTRSRIKVGRNGTLTFAVTVPGPGTVDVLATASNDNLARAAIRLRPATRRFVYARSHLRARRATTLHLRVRPNARGRWLVRHHTFRVTLRLWISYTPRGGRARTFGVHGLHLPR
jgi:uncharacterized protein YjbI with pentapeptide repeats